MEVAVIPGLFVAIFVGIAAMILWWPYDKRWHARMCASPFLRLSRSRRSFWCRWDLLVAKEDLSLCDRFHEVVEVEAITVEHRAR
jgi:hypothetical protein